MKGAASEFIHGCWKDAFAHRLLDRGFRFLVGYQPEASLRSLPYGPLRRAAHSMAAGIPRSEQEKVSKMEVIVFLKMTDHHFCRFLFI